MNIVRCDLCGFRYDESNSIDRKAHQARCRAVEKAKRKFGEQLEPVYSRREQVKKENWILVDNNAGELGERAIAAKKILWMWFSRSVAESGWSLRHPNFQKWSGSFLQSEKSVFPSEIYKALVRMYPGRAARRKVG